MPVGVVLGRRVGRAYPEKVGWELVGIALGLLEGRPVGAVELGCAEGRVLGWRVGCTDGCLEGCLDGCLDGCPLGCPVGRPLGCPEGCLLG